MHRAKGEILNQAIHDFSRTVLGNLALSRANLYIRIYLMVVGHVPVDLDGAEKWSNFRRQNIRLFFYLYLELFFTILRIYIWWSWRGIVLVAGIILNQD